MPLYGTWGNINRFESILKLYNLSKTQLLINTNHLPFSLVRWRWVELCKALVWYYAQPLDMRRLFDPHSNVAHYFLFICKIKLRLPNCSLPKTCTGLETKASEFNAKNLFIKRYYLSVRLQMFTSGFVIRFTCKRVM